MSVTIQDRALEFGVFVLKLFRNAERSPQSSVLCHQVYRSSTSIGANIIEGQNATSRKEFIRYLNIALRSSRETEYWLRICERVELTDTRKIIAFFRKTVNFQKFLHQLFFQRRQSNQAILHSKFSILN